MFTGLELIPPLNAELHHNLQLCNMMEVTERVLSTSKINTSLAKGIVFTFQADMLELELVNCAGMVRVFLLAINTMAMTALSPSLIFNLCHLQIFAPVTVSPVGCGFLF
jgi:hypothetical protein